jgi:AraC-like DNA-binding protein
MELRDRRVLSTMLGRCDGTFTTVRRDFRQVLATNDDRCCLVRNSGHRESRLTHRGREFVLRPGSIALSDVAFECGFNDLSYFNRCFRRRFGLTPSAARGR